MSLEHTEINPTRLTFIKDVCSFCNCPTSSQNEKPTIKIFELYHLYGWIICDNIDCITSLKQSVIEYYNSNLVIPLRWYSKQNNEPLCFYRKRTNNVIGSLNKTYNFSDDITTQFIIWIREKDNQLYMNLQFNDINGEQMSKTVSLTNIFFHNPNFYNDITSTTNLFNEPRFEIGYNDLSDKIKGLVKKTYDEMLTLPKDHIFDL